MIHFLKEQGTLTDDIVSLIQELVDEATGKMAKFASYKPIDIVVADNQNMVIPEQGLGGYTSTAYELYIPLDMSRPDIEACIREHLPSTIAHELCHIIRLQAGVPFATGATLADNAIGEGLADHMSLLLYPKQATPWTSALDGKIYAELLSRFNDEKDDSYYDHNAWFYGAEYANIPRWAGYTIGYKLIEEYLKNNSKNTISELLTLPTKTFIK